MFLRYECVAVSGSSKDGAGLRQSLACDGMG